VTDLHRLNATSDVNYTIIVNPESGPGNTSLPNEDYLPAIQRLNAFPNTRTVGYVRTGYGNRSLDDVLQDIATYSGWANSTQGGIEMHGIFFDEAAHDYTAEVAEYMQTANDAVKSASGLSGNKTVRNISLFRDTQLTSDRSSTTLVLSLTHDWPSKPLTSLSSSRSPSSATERLKAT
jgi:hypothetical protein